MEVEQELTKLRDIVSRYLGVPEDKMYSDCLQRPHVYARHLYCYTAKQFVPGATLAEIGMPINRRHATVLNSARQLGNWSENDKNVQRDINAIKNLIFQNNHVEFLKHILRNVPPERLGALIRIFDSWVLEEYLNSI